MPVTYPLTLPGVPGFTSFSMRLVNAVGSSRSPFTGVTRTYDWGGAWWRAEFALPPMRRQVAERWLAVLLSLDGPEGTFWLGDPDGRTPQGRTLTAPKVNGAGQTGEDLAIKNLTPSTAGALAAGDYLQVGSSLHKLVKPVDSDGSGNGVATLRPELRGSPADSLDLIIAGARGLFRLADVVDWSTDELAIYGLSVSAIEDVQ